MRLFASVWFVVFFLTGCDSGSTINKSTQKYAGTDAERISDPVMIKEGGEVYRRYCAQCHGKHGEGDPNWRKRNADDSFPPPPLNGSGHAWHHSKAWLKEKIKTGKPLRNMPAWGGKLSDREIEAVIAWFQAQWSDPVYEAWRNNQLRAVQSR